MQSSQGVCKQAYYRNPYHTPALDPPTPLAAGQAKYLALHTGHTEEEIMQDFSRPRYFNPYEAAEYGLIDQVRPAPRDISVVGDTQGATRWMHMLCLN
jgi:hypothetical protein